jgi:hypothetical protein
VGRANFVRRIHACFDSVAQAAKFFEHLGGSQGEVSFDVFKVTPLRVNFLDNSLDVGPKVTGIVFSLTPSGKGERLAGISARDEMNLTVSYSIQDNFERMLNGVLAI